MTYDLSRTVAGLPQSWASFLTDWDRTLRSGNYPLTTRYNYLLAAAQLARYLATPVGATHAQPAASTPTAVTGSRRSG